MAVAGGLTLPPWMGPLRQVPNGRFQGCLPLLPRDGGVPLLPRNPVWLAAMTGTLAIFRDGNPAD